MLVLVAVELVTHSSEEAVAVGTHFFDAKIVLGELLCQFVVVHLVLVLRLFSIKVLECRQLCFLSWSVNRIAVLVISVIRFYEIIIQKRFIVI